MLACAISKFSKEYENLSYESIINTSRVTIRSFIFLTYLILDSNNFLFIMQIQRKHLELHKVSANPRKLYDPRPTSQLQKSAYKFSTDGAAVRRPVMAALTNAGTVHRMQDIWE